MHNGIWNALFYVLKLFLASLYTRRIFWREIPKITVCIGKVTLESVSNLLGHGAFALIVSTLLVLSVMYTVLLTLNRTSHESVRTVLSGHLFSLDSMAFVCHPKWRWMALRDRLYRRSKASELQIDLRF